MNDSAFESWYNGLVGFHINSERIIDDLNDNFTYEGVSPEKLRKWMAVCWNNAIDAAINVCWLENEVPDLEALKERS
jgi:hypothetical protein